MAERHETILSLENVSLGLRRGLVLAGVTFELRPGDLLLVAVNDNTFISALGDAIQGLVDPIEGIIRFCGMEWKEMSQREVDLNRASIGRVFETDLWLHGMDLEENIMLGGLHHDTVSRKELEQRACRLARLFELDPPPVMFPEQAHSSVLIQAGYIRAFLCDPELVILENPLRSERELFPALIQAIEEVRSRAGAVLWVEKDPEISSNPRLNPSQFASIEGRTFVRKEMYGASA